MGNNTDYHFPFIWLQKNTVVNQLSIDHLHRREYVNPIDTIRIEKNSVVNVLNLRDITVENHTGNYCARLVNRGTVGKLYAVDMYENDINNEGTIEELICQ